MCECKFSAHLGIWSTVAGSCSKNEMGIPDKLTCLLRKLYDGQEETVRTQYGATEQFGIEKGVQLFVIQCLLSSCLFNLYSEHIMRNARLDEL